MRSTWLYILGGSFIATSLLDAFNAYRYFDSGLTVWGWSYVAFGLISIVSGVAIVMVTRRIDEDEASMEYPVVGLEK